MVGYGIWRPAVVVAAVSAAAFLPQGVAVAATPATLGTVSCSQLSEQLRAASLDCRPVRHDGVDGLFIGPVSPSSSPAGQSATGTASLSTGSTDAGSAGSDGSDDHGSGSSDADGADSDKSNSGSNSGSNSDNAGSDDSDSDDSDDSDDSGSSSSSNSGSDDSDSSSSSTSSTDSTGTSVSATTGVELGAAACPSSVTGATAATGTTGTTGSTDAATNGAGTDTSGSASLTDLTGGAGNGTAGATGTANNLLSTGTAGSPVAGADPSAAATAVGSASMPADVIDLAPWYLTLPTGAAGSPETIENPALAKFTNEAFKLTEKRDGVVFSARVGGVTTKNSSYPRSELREMNGSEKASWSNASGSHTLDVCEAIMKVPSAKPHIVGAQLHDGNDDVMQIRLEGKTLMVQYDDGKSQVVMDPDYTLGTPYNVRIIAEGGKVQVLYNGEQKAELPLKGSGWYWKVGAYVQSNTEKGDAPDATGEVAVYSLKMVHA